MKIWTDYLSLREQEETTEYSALGPGTLLLDIETTGFSAKYCSIYLIGCAVRRDDQLLLTQFFAETPAQEEEILVAFANYLSDKGSIITFNGQAFDLPFLEERAKRTGTPLSLNKLISIDLYRVARKYRAILHLPSYKQKSIEEALHIKREDSCSGGQLIDVYQNYCQSRAPEAEALLALHNHDDVFGMYPLLALLSYEKLRHAKVALTDIQSNDQEMLLKATLNLNLPAMARIHSRDIRLLLEENRLRASIPLRRTRMRYELDRPADYYYLPEEDIVVPKVLASSIDSTRRRKATRQNCCIKREGIFLPIADFVPEPKGIPIFRENTQSRQAYLECPENQPKEFMQNYLEALLHSIENYRS